MTVKRRTRLHHHRRPFRWRAPLSLEPLEARFLPTSTPIGLHSLPLAFEVNQGQAAGEVKFLARDPGYDLFGFFILGLLRV